MSKHQSLDDAIAAAAGARSDKPRRTGSPDRSKIMSKEMIKYAINKDLSIEFLYSFSSPQGDEFAFGVDHGQLMAIHPHAIALKSALARRGSTEYEYRVGCARAFGPEIRICLTCRNPDDEIGYGQEQFAIIEEAGLALYEGWVDETGDHALVQGRQNA